MRATPGSLEVVWALGRDRSGHAILELSFVLPVLLVIACGIGDVAMGFTKRLVVQQAAARALEMTLAKGFGSTSEATARTEAATAAGVEESRVTATAWLECGGTKQVGVDAVSGTCAVGAGAPTRYLSVTVTDTYSSSLGPMLALLKAGNWSAVPLTGYAVVRVQ